MFIERKTLCETVKVSLYLNVHRKKNFPNIIEGYSNILNHGRNHSGFRLICIPEMIFLPFRKRP